MKITFNILLILLIKVAFGQVQELRKYHTIPEEQIVLNLNYNTFSKFPADFEMKPQSLEFSIYSMQTIFGKNYPVSLAGGLGVSVNNYKNNTFLFETKDSLFFTKIPDTVEYRKNKFAMVYIDIPIEFRLRSRPIVKKRNVKIAFGFKIGYNIQRYIKYEGDDFLNLTSADKIKMKRYKIEHFLPYRYGVFVRAGYGKFSLNAYYSLTPLFSNNTAIETYPFSLGMSITIF